MNRFPLRMNCAALSVVSLALATVSVARAEDYQDDPRMTLFRRNIEELTRRMNTVDDRLRHLESPAGPMLTSPAETSTGTIRLANYSGGTAVVEMGGRLYRLPPRTAVNLRAGTGTHYYRLRTGDSRWYSLTLDNDDAVLIVIRGGGDDD